MNRFNQPTDLIRVLRAILWLAPISMALLGLSYALDVYLNLQYLPVPPWPFFLGVVVLGSIGPVATFLGLRWAIRKTEDLLHSRRECDERTQELVLLNNLFAASRSLELDQIMSTILSNTVEALEANAGMLFLRENGGDDLVLQTHTGISDGMAEQEAVLTPGHCLCGQAADSREVLLALEVGQDPRCTSDVCICDGFRSVACAPLDVNGQLVGLIQLASAEAAHFTESQRDFLNAAAAQLSVAIENARLYDEVQSFNSKLEDEIVQRTGELEKARASLAKKAHQLQGLLSESYRVQEETKERIAHDMHDGVTQTIIGALFEIQAAQDSMLKNPNIASVNLSRAQELLADVDQEIRRVIFDFHPPVLDMLGLVAAVERYATTFEQTYNIACRVRVAGEKHRLDKQTELTIYRIVQSAMLNIATHSSASRARVRFSFEPQNLQVSVEDNGVGFDPQETLATPGEHLGLIGMIERAESLGATLLLESLPEQGTRIILNLPTHQDADRSLNEGMPMESLAPISSAHDPLVPVCGNADCPFHGDS
jgi:two-component system sensor histidine kinase DegS